MFANCWRANKRWCASIVARMWSLWICCWLADWVFEGYSPSRSGNICVLCQVTPRTFLTLLFVRGCKFSLVFQNCHFLRENYWTAIKTELFFRDANLSASTVWKTNVGKRNYIAYNSQYTTKNNKQQLWFRTFVSHFFNLFFDGKHNCLHAKLR